MTVTPRSMLNIVTNDNGCAHIISLYFFTTDEPLNRGLWNIENNHVLLTETMYQEWNGIRNEPDKQKLFFKKLEKVSQFTLTE